MDAAVVKTRKMEMDGLKQPASMDEILEAKLAPVIESINGHVQRIYHDFNTAMHKQHQNLGVVERDISQMVQILWGLFNKANARNAALERVLIKNGLKELELSEEILLVESELEKTGEWKNMNLNEVAKEIGLEFKNQAPQ